MCIKRGEIYYADLRPVIGSEQGGVRPVLILQNDIGNMHSPTVICAAITGRNRHMPTHFTLSPRGGLYEKSIVLFEQLRTIDKKRLKEKVAECTLDEMQEIDKRLIISLGMSAVLI